MRRALRGLIKPAAFARLIVVAGAALIVAAVWGITGWTGGAAAAGLALVLYGLLFIDDGARPVQVRRVRK